MIYASVMGHEKKHRLLFYSQSGLGSGLGKAKGHIALRGAGRLLWGGSALGKEGEGSSRGKGQDLRSNKSRQHLRCEKGGPCPMVLVTPLGSVYTHTSVLMCASGLRSPGQWCRRQDTNKLHANDILHHWLWIAMTASAS